MLGGMSLFDSICHAFGTVSTSGYSTYNTSMGHFKSAYFDWVTIIFMFLGGITFSLFYSMYRKDWLTVLINTELRWYCWITVIFSVGVSLVLLQHGTYNGLLESLRYGTFQVISLMTTTGFTTADYEQWAAVGTDDAFGHMFYWRLCRFYILRYQSDALCTDLEVYGGGY